MGLLECFFGDEKFRRWMKEEVVEWDSWKFIGWPSSIHKQSTLAFLLGP